MNHSRKTEVLATFFYLGRAPLMPGTVGTLGAIPMVYLFGQVGHLGYIALTFLFVLFSVWCSDRYESMVQDHDRKEVVIDEVCGFIMAMYWLPLTWQSFAAAFVLFRFLDILKPFPISLIDRRVAGGFGTVLDDLAAGVIVNIALQFVYTQTNWLGVQWVPGT